MDTVEVICDKIKSYSHYTTQVHLRVNLFWEKVVKAFARTAADSTKTQKSRTLLTKSEQNRQQSLLAFSKK